MAIDGISSIGRLDRPEDRRVENNDPKVNRSGSEQESRGDSVELSGGDLARFSSLLEEIPEERTDRIEELQEKIRNNEYNVPPEDIAERLLDELI